MPPVVGVQASIAQDAARGVKRRVRRDRGARGDASSVIFVP
jgi:hypothetical protein